MSLDMNMTFPPARRVLHLLRSLRAVRFLACPALNMFLQTAAIEFARKNPQAILAALQPGTVASPLSQPFATPDHCTPVGESVDGLLKALDALAPKSSAHFVDFKGESIGW